MIYKGDFGHPSQIYTDIQVVPDLEANLEKYFDQYFLGSLSPQRDNMMSIIHGPYSQPHLARINDSNREKLKPLLMENGEVIKTTDNAQQVGIPQSETINNEFLIKRIQDNYKKLGIQFIQPNLNTNLVYGDFQPVQIFKGFDKEGYGLDPKLFLTAFLSQIALERKNFKQKGEAIIVLHTDFPYFLSEGRHEKVSESIAFIDNLARTMGLKVAIENNEISKNTVFQDAVPWGIDPERIADKVMGTSSMGVCIDIKHCIVNGLKVEDIELKLKKIKDLNIPVVIHTRDSYLNNPELQPLMNYIFANAIPIAYEP